MDTTVNPIAYLPRIVDALLAERLRIMPMAVIDGPRACGKTTTASRLAQRILPLDRDHAAREAVFTPAQRQSEMNARQAHLRWRFRS